MYILNIILPVWMFFMFSWWIFLISVVGNFIIDYGIYELFLRRVKERIIYKWKYIWRAYLLGFGADLIVAFMLIGLYALPNSGINYFTIYDNPLSIVVHIAALILTGFIIYFFNKLNLKKSGLSTLNIHRLSLIMAILTAPFTFLIPSGIFNW